MQTHPTLSWITHFQTLPNLRVNRAKDHDLIDILVIATSNLLCDGETFNDMDGFGDAKRDGFESFLARRNRISSRDTLNRLLGTPDRQALGQCLVHRAQSLRPAIAQEIVALDGKGVYSVASRRPGRP